MNFCLLDSLKYQVTYKFLKQKENYRHSFSNWYIVFESTKVRKYWDEL